MNSTSIRSDIRDSRVNKGVDKNFALLWFGEGVSLVGNSTTALLIPVLAAVRLHAGPSWMGALAAAAWLPWLLIGLPAGALVDRLHPRYVMMVADLCSAAALLVIPIVSSFGWLNLSELVTVTFVGGVCTVFFELPTPSSYRSWWRPKTSKAPTPGCSAPSRRPRSPARDSPD